MQTFLPYSSFAESLACLDNARLGKQRVEAFQILRTLRGESSGWANHPAVKMWNSYENALAVYMNTAIYEWKSRGFKNSMSYVIPISRIVYPKWLGDDRFHSSHRSNLLRKNPSHYSRFGWTESPDLPYFWPTKEGY